MKKLIRVLAIVIVFVQLLLCTFSFSSCGSYRQYLLNKTDEQLGILGDVCETIVLAFNEKDLTLLDEILSESCAEQWDLQEGFLYSCNLFDGEITTVEASGSPIQSHMEKAGTSAKADASFILTTSSGKTYNLYFEYWYDNDFDAKKIGVNRIKLSDIDAFQKGEGYVSGRLYDRSGIYYPAWDEDE